MAPQTAPLPLIEVSGTPHARGVSYGQQARDRVRQAVAFYRLRLERGGLTGASLTSVIDDVIRVSEDFSGEIVEEMRGIAEGADVTLEDVFVVNASIETMRLAMVRSGKSGGRPDEDGCTALAVRGGATADGRTLHAQNWDWLIDTIDFSVILHARRDDGPDVILFTEAGGLCRNGISSVGIGVTANFLSSDKDFEAVGVPLTVMRRAVLQDPTLNGSLSLAKNTPLSGSINLMVSHADGFAVDVERAPRQAFLIQPKRDILVHANHFESPAALAALNDESPMSCSTYRGWRAEKILRDNHGRIAETEIKQALGDRFAWPNAVCRPPIVNAAGDRSGTVVTVVMDAAAGVIDVAPVPGDGAHYTTYALQPDQVGRANAIAAEPMPVVA